LLPWRGKPLVRHVIERIEPQVNQLLINANRNLSEYRALGFDVCQDQLADFQGPLAGIQAAMAIAKQPLLLVCPCDTPLLPADLASQLLAAMENHGADIAFPSCGDRAHYLPVLLKTSLAPALSHYLKGSDRSVKGWYKTLNYCALPFATSEAFRNFNSAAELD
jgi:molybdenum cofactor guanylyltransferase